VLAKIREIEQFHSSALHWNLNELNANLHDIIDWVKSSYSEIEKLTGVKLYNSKGLDNFKEKIGKDVSLFMAFSRGKADDGAVERICHIPAEKKVWRPFQKRKLRSRII
jgi:hypothetical protein